MFAPNLLPTVFPDDVWAWSGSTPAGRTGRDLVVLLVALTGTLACGYVDVCVRMSNEGFVTLHEHRPLADPREARSQTKPA